MSKRTSDEASREKAGPQPSRPIDEKRIVVEFTRNFDKNFVKLPLEVQEKARQTIEVFLDCYVTRQFPKSLRVHKCGPFLSLSLTMNYRIFVLPIQGGVKSAFVGDHEEAQRYLRKG